MNFFLDIMQKIPVNALLMLSAFSVILGDFFAKYWSTNQRAVFFLLALVGYFFSGFFYIPTLLREGLIVTSIVWSLLSIIGFLILGLIIFNESLTSFQTIGVILGIAALIILMFW